MNDACEELSIALIDNEVRLINAANKWREKMFLVLKDIYSYNSIIRDTGYYLKPMHVVVKRKHGVRIEYVYYGRYWWTIKYAGKHGKTSRIKWVYMGNIKPRGLPDPPNNPLTGMTIKIVNEDIIINKHIFEKYKDIILGMLCGSKP